MIAERARRIARVAAFAALPLLLVALVCATPVPSGRAAVIAWRGTPSRTVAAPRGVVWHWPLVETVSTIDMRPLVSSADKAPLVSASGEVLRAEAFALWQVRDPLRFARTLGDSTNDAEAVVHAAIAAALAQAASSGDAAALGRGARDRAIGAALDRDLARYGIGVTLAAVRRVAPAEGAPGEAAVVRSQARLAAETEAVAARGISDAALIRAEAEARVGAIYAASFGRDPAFYDFYRAMQSYSGVLGQKDSRATIVIAPDSAYLKQFKGQ